VYQQTRDEFFHDVRRARLLLEDVASLKVGGYRAPGFSTTEDTPWFFDALVDAGYEYDSSVFPAARGHGGIRAARRDPHRVGQGESLVEMPITVANVLGKPMCFFGGGYLRLSPYWLIRHQALKVLDEGRPVVFYIHPREIDPDHPRIPMNRKRQFKSYVNLGSTGEKIRRILEDFPVTTFRDVILTKELAKSYVS
jgi:polysaccharide deacetylase family protein (PEP-CTERM system associated)